MCTRKSPLLMWFAAADIDPQYFPERLSPQATGLFIFVPTGQAYEYRDMPFDAYYGEDPNVFDVAGGVLWAWEE